jgi:hypothetical protein
MAQIFNSLKSKDMLTGTNIDLDENKYEELLVMAKGLGSSKKLKKIGEEGYIHYPPKKKGCKNRCKNPVVSIRTGTKNKVYRPPTHNGLPVSKKNKNSKRPTKTIRKQNKNKN